MSTRVFPSDKTHDPVKIPLSDTLLRQQENQRLDAAGRRKSQLTGRACGCTFTTTLVLLNYVTKLKMYLHICKLTHTG